MWNSHVGGHVRKYCRLSLETEGGPQPTARRPWILPSQGNALAYHLWVWKKTPSSDENADLADTLILAWWDSEHGIQSHHARYLTYKKCEIIFCCFKPLHLWYSVMQNWKITQLERKHVPLESGRFFSCLLFFFIPDVFSSVQSLSHVWLFGDTLEIYYRRFGTILVFLWQSFRYKIQY